MKVFAVILCFLALQVLVVSLPKNLIFDEVWYVGSARHIIETGTNYRPEHPPLAQVLIAIGITLFGDNPWGWRIFSVTFGVLSVATLYLLVRRLTADETMAVTAASILAFDKMFFTFSSLAVLDIYFIFFTTMSFYFYSRGRVAMSASTSALGAVSKMTAVLTFPILAAYHAALHRCHHLKDCNRWKPMAIWAFVFTISFLFFLYAFDRVYRHPNSIDYANPIEHLRFMLETHASKSWDKSAGSEPWRWLLSPGNYYLGGVSLVRNTFLETFNPFTLGLCFASIPYAFYHFVKQRDRASLLSLIWFSIGYFVWFPTYFLFTRPLYSFYVITVIPAVAISNSTMFGKDAKTSLFYILATIAYFLLFQYPIRLIWT